MMFWACVYPEVSEGSPHTLGSPNCPKAWAGMWPVMAHSGGLTACAELGAELNMRTGLFARLPCRWPRFTCQPGDSWGPTARFLMSSQKDEVGMAGKMGDQAVGGWG